MRHFVSIFAVLLALAGPAQAQIEAVDPSVADDAPAPDKPKKNDLQAVDPALKPPPGDTEEDPDEPPRRVLDEPDQPDAFARPGEKKPVGKKAVGGAADPLDKKRPGARKGDDKAAPAGPAKPPPVIEVRKTSDVALQSAWNAWQQADKQNDVTAEQEARARLLALRQDIDASDMDAWAVGLIRAASVHEAKGDSGAAVEMANTAVQLAPSLPAAWTGLARVYFSADPTEIGRVLTALGKAARATWEHPRYRRPQVAHVAATVIIALMGTAIAFLLVVLARRGYYFLYDFHFLFPRAAARWQTAALAVLVLSVPIVFRMGLAPVLLVMFAAATLYATTAERVLSVALIGLLGAVPLVTGLVVEHTAWADTTAEQLDTLERGGQGAELVAARVRELAGRDKATVSQKVALARFDLRRGNSESATELFKQVLAARPQDARAKNNLGVALMLSGDLENSRALFETAIAEDPTLAEASFNLGRLFQRRVVVLGDVAAGDIDRAAAAMTDARQKDMLLSESIDAKLSDTLVVGNTWLRTAPMVSKEIVGAIEAGDGPDRAASQMSGMVLGEVPPAAAPFYPAAVAVLLVGLGLLGRSIEAARACSKCGQPVSRRGDPDLSPGSGMCTQCINVFTKAHLVAPTLKVRKQAEIRKFQQRLTQVTTVLGLLLSGLGHIFNGLPVRGAAYVFVFLSVVTAAVLRNGVLRAPYEALPLWLRLVPLGVVLVTVYLVSFRELRKSVGGK